MPFELVPPGTRIDFVGHARLCAFVSLLLVLGSIAAIAIRGLNLGVDFAGGTLIQFSTGADFGDERAVREVLAEASQSDASVARIGVDADARFQVLIPVSDPEALDELVPSIEVRLTRALGTLEIEKVEFVGPRAGEDLRRSAVLCLVLSLALIFLYVALRFSPAYAPGAVVALLHDVVITAGIFVVLGWEFDFTTIAALLTILGYSLNDTLIIYDRIRENRRAGRSSSLAEVVNQSVNDTLSRTFLTSGTTLLTVLSLLVLGGPELRGFSTAMVIGILVGTYSSVYVASPLMILIEDWNRGRGRPGVASTDPQASVVGRPFRVDREVRESLGESSRENESGRTR